MRTVIEALETQAEGHRERFSARTGNSEAAVRRTTSQQALLLWATIKVAGQDLRDQTRNATGEPGVLIGSDINWDVDLLTDIASAALESARAPHHLTSNT